MTGRSLTDFKSKHNPDQEVEFLRTQVRNLERIIDEERRTTGETRELIYGLSQAIEAAAPIEVTYTPPEHKDASTITHVVHLTDLHYGEVIARDEVEGVNEYSPEIAKRRVSSLARKVHNKTVIMRKGYHVPKLHILGTADYISGDIHPELRVTNAFPCPVQAVGCGDMIASFVMMLAPYFREIEVDLITLDNHGRLTVKNQAAQGGLNNWGYVVATIAQARLSAQTNVKVNVHPQASALVPIGVEKYLLFHGHQIRGWAGVPYYGFDRRVAMEAVKRMEFNDMSFTKLLCGHFHVAVDSMYWMIGGSLSGTNAYDHANGRHSQAHQTSWFVHPTHGQFDFTRWWLK